MRGDNAVVRPLAGERFVLFGPQHLVVLGIFGLGCIGAVALGRRLRGRPAVEARVRRVAGVVVLVVCAPFEVVDWIHDVPQWRTSLPLQICDVAWLVAGIALLSRSRAWCALLYYWGLTLCLQGVLTPELFNTFPQWPFLGFWARHLTPPWAALLVVGLGVGPSWREYRLVLAVTAAWAALCIGLNEAYGSNYGYLRAKPVTHSLLSVLGPWPWYVLVEVALVASVWALITWPWSRRPRSR